MEQCSALWIPLLRTGCPLSSSFFFNDTATTEIYTLSLHDALPIFDRDQRAGAERGRGGHDERPDAARTDDGTRAARPDPPDRKSTRLNSSHRTISYAVFCLKKKKENTRPQQPS